MSERIKSFRLKVPVGSKVELWSSGTSYQTTASVVHGTVQEFFGHVDLNRPPAPEPPTNPPPAHVIAEKGQLYSVFFTSEFTTADNTTAKLKVVITNPAGQQHEDAKTFEVTGKAADGPDLRIVVFETRKK